VFNPDNNTKNNPGNNTKNNPGNNTKNNPGNNTKSNLGTISEHGGLLPLKNIQMFKF
jgi:hypothetical protein